MADNPNNPDDIIYDASVNNKTEEFFKKFDEDLDKLTRSAEEGFDNVEGSINRAGITAGLVGGAMALVTQSVATAALGAIQAFVGFAKQSTELRAQVDTLGISLNVVATNAGISGDEVNELEEEIKSMGITTRAARNNMVQMIEAELDLSKAAELARASQDVAVVSLTNSSEAYQRMLHAVVTLQPEMLRMMNLTVNYQGELERTAKGLNKTVGLLSEQEKKQALLNATLKAASAVQGAYESAMDSSAKKLSLIHI